MAPYVFFGFIVIGISVMLYYCHRSRKKSIQVKTTDGPELPKK